MASWIIIIGGIVLIVLLIIGVIVSSNSESAIVEQRLDQYFENTNQDEGERQAQRAVLTEWVSRRVEKTSFGDRIARELARADLKFKVGEYLALIAISILVGGAIAWFIGSRHPVSFLFGAIAGAFAPRYYVSRQKRVRAVDTGIQYRHGLARTRVSICPCRRGAY